MKKRFSALAQVLLAMILYISLLSGCSIFEIYEEDTEESTESVEESKIGESILKDKLGNITYEEEDAVFIGGGKQIPLKEIQKCLEVASSKKYVMVVDDEEEIGCAALTIDEENGTFLFSYDMLSSYLPYGTYKINGNILTATTDDGLYKYLFKLVDEDTLKFIKNGSADVSLIDDRFGVQIEDGAEFKWDVLVRPTGKKVWWRSFEMQDETDFYEIPVGTGDVTIPKEELTKFSTEQLIDACLNDRWIGYIYTSSSTMDDGFQRAINAFNGYEELFQREDAGSALLQIYREMNHEEIVTKELDSFYIMRIRHFETLLQREEILTKLSEEERNELRALAYNYNDLRNRYYNDIFGMDFSASLIYHIDQMNSKQ